MNITPWELYWIIKLDDIRTAFLAISLISLVIALLLGGTWFVEATGMYPNKEVVKTLRRTINALTISTILSAFVAIFTPTSAQMAAIKLAPVLMNTEIAQKELPAETMELYGLLKQYLNESTNKEAEK